MLAIAGSTSALAQGVDKPAPPAPSARGAIAEADADRLQDIVVTAQRREQSLQDVPVSVTAIDALSLERSSTFAVADLPQSAPALTYTTGAQPAFASFNIRGVGSYVYRIGVQPAVSVIMDGIPMARTAEFAGELGDVERVEVLSGPQGTLFGRNSTGGAINVVHKRPTPYLEGYVHGELVAGEHGDVETLIRGTLNLPVSDSVRLRVHAYNRQNSDYLHNYYDGADIRPKDAGAHRATGVQARIEFDLAPSVTLLVSGDYLDDYSRNGSASVVLPLQQYQAPLVPNVTAQQTAILGDAIGDRFGIYTYQPFATGIELGGGVAELKWDVAPKLTVTSLTSYREAKLESATTIYINSTTDPRGFPFVSLGTSAQNPTGYNRVTRWHYVTQEVRGTYASAAADIVGGVYYFRLKEDELADNPLYQSAQALGRDALVGTPTGPSAAFPYYYFNNITNTADTNTVVAGFADVTLHPAEGLDIFGGYRLSRETLDFTYRKDRYLALPVQLGTNFDSTTWSPTVPISPQSDFGASRSETLWAGRAGISYQATPDVRTYFSYSHGYIGSGFDAGNNPAGTNADPAASFLRPSKADSYEIGVRTELFDRHLRLNATGFWMKTRDVQVTALVPGTIVNVVQNAGDIVAKGIELDFAAHFSRRFQVTGGASYLDATIRDLSQACYPGQTAAQGCAGGTQSVDGTPALNAPKWKFNAAATYEIPVPSRGFDLYLRGDMQYRSKTWFQLDHDPLATDPAHVFLNFSTGLTTTDGRYDFRLFVHNLTDEYYCDNMVNGPFYRQGCQSTPIGAQRRFGASAKVNF